MIDLIRLFDKVNILTRGGPANTTATITQYIYNYGVGSFKIGYSSVGSVVMTLIIYSSDVAARAGKLLKEDDAKRIPFR